MKRTEAVYLRYENGAGEEVERWRFLIYLLLTSNTPKQTSTTFTSSPKHCIGVLHRPIFGYSFYPIQ